MRWAGLQRKHKETSEEMEVSIVLIVEIISQLYTYAQAHQISSLLRMWMLLYDNYTSINLQRKTMSNYYPSFMKKMLNK